MKTFIRVLVVALLGGVLFVTNPTEDEFEAYVRERVEKKLSEDAGDRTLGRLLTDLGSSVVGSLAARVAERDNYFLFSTYRVDVGADGDPDEAWRFVGVAGRFIETASPETD